MVAVTAVVLPVIMLLQGAKGADKHAGKPELQLLHSITGTFRPGVLTALMGVSGECSQLCSASLPARSSIAASCVCSAQLRTD